MTTTASAIMFLLRLVAVLLLLSVKSNSSQLLSVEVNCNETTSSDSTNEITECLPVGESFNILHGYGFLSFSIHVAPLAPSPPNQNGHSSTTKQSSKQNDSVKQHHMHLFHLTTHPVLDRRYENVNI